MTRTRMPPRRRLWIALAGACCCGVGTAQAGVHLNVNNCDDAGNGSLRAVVAGAADDAVVELDDLTCSTITLTSGAIAITQDSLTLVGPADHQLTIRTGDYFDYRVLKHTGDGTLTVRDLTLADGKYSASEHAVTVARGGCIFSAGHVTLEHARVIDCKAQSAAGPALGGGIYAQDGASLQDSFVTGNDAKTIAAGFDAMGGGIHVANGHRIDVDTSTVCGNLASSVSGVAAGGGVYAGVAYLDRSLVCANRASSGQGDAYGGGVMGGRLVDLRQGCVISGNSVHSGGHGGGAWGGGLATGRFSGVDPASRLRVSDAIVRGNSASVICNVSCSQAAGGGMAALGLFDASLPVLVTRSAIIGNSVLSNTEFAAGGGIFALNLEVGLGNATVSGNTVQGSGGGLAAYEFYIYNSTIVGNAASEHGGGLKLDFGSQAIIDSSVVANNAAATGDDIGAPSSTPVFGSNNLIEHVSANIILPPDTLQVEPELLPLAVQGGSWHVPIRVPTTGSPLLDTARNIANLTTDQRDSGYLRLVGSAVDIGAAERQGPGDGDRIFGNSFGYTWGDSPIAGVPP